MDLKVSPAESATTACATMAAAIQEPVPGDHDCGLSLSNIEDTTRVSSIHRAFLQSSGNMTR